MKCGPYSKDHNPIRSLYFTYNETPNLPGLNSLGGYSFSFDCHTLMRIIVAPPTNAVGGRSGRQWKNHAQIFIAGTIVRENRL
jgi:hypothetical protein